MHPPDRAILPRVTPSHRQAVSGRLGTGLEVYEAGSQLLGARSAEHGVSLADRLEDVSVAAARRCDPLTTGERLGRHLVGPDQEGQRVVHLERVEGAFSGGGCEQVASARSVHALHRERVRDDCDATLLLDGEDGIGGAHAGEDLLFEEQTDDVSFSGGDLLSDDDVEAVLLSERLRVKRALDGVVIGDGDDIEVRAVLHVLHDLRDARETVAVVRVDMNIRLAPSVRHAIESFHRIVLPQTPSNPHALTSAGSPGV